LEQREDAIRKRQSQLMNQPEMQSLQTSSPEASTERVVPADDLGFGQQKIRLMAAIIGLTAIVAVSAVIFIPKEKKPAPEEPNPTANQVDTSSSAADVTSTKKEDATVTVTDAPSASAETVQSQADSGTDTKEIISEPKKKKATKKRRRARTNKKPRKKPVKRPRRKKIQIDDDDSF